MVSQHPYSMPDHRDSTVMKCEAETWVTQAYLTQEPFHLPSFLLLYSGHHPNRHLSQDTTGYTILENAMNSKLTISNCEKEATHFN